MVFVLDNYDSFTYNLVQYMGELGADLVVRRNDELTPAEVEALHPTHILISPGPCTPQDAGISIELIRHFARRAEGGRASRSSASASATRPSAPRSAATSSAPEADARQDQRSYPRRQDHLQRHPVRDDLHPLPLAHRLGRRACPANSRSRNHPRRREGTTIMALRHRDLPIEGVQFHPESVLTTHGKKIVENFLKM